MSTSTNNPYSSSGRADQEDELLNQIEHLRHELDTLQHDVSHASHISSDQTPKEQLVQSAGNHHPPHSPESPAGAPTSEIGPTPFQADMTQRQIEDIAAGALQPDHGAVNGEEQQRASTGGQRARSVKPAQVA